MKKTILALSVLFVSAASLEARGRRVQETFEVSCNACGHQHYITEIRNEVIPTPVERVCAKETRSEAPALVLAGTVIGATVTMVLLACTAAVVSETLFLFGCVWFVATIFSSEVSSV